MEKKRGDTGCMGQSSWKKMACSECPLSWNHSSIISTVDGVYCLVLWPAFAQYTAAVTSEIRDSFLGSVQEPSVRPWLDLVSSFPPTVVGC